MRFFKETQRFDQWWFHLINILVLGVMIYPTYQAFRSNNLEATEIYVLILAFILVLLLLGLVYSIKLRTQIDEKGIHYGFFPFHRKNRIVPWSNIEHCYVRTYNPIMEYGGWGYRGIRRNSKAFNIKGNQGIQIVFKTGGKLLIGTQKTAEAGQIINRYFKQDEGI